VALEREKDRYIVGRCSLVAKIMKENLEKNVTDHGNGDNGDDDHNDDDNDDGDRSIDIKDDINNTENCSDFIQNENEKKNDDAHDENTKIPNKSKKQIKDKDSKFDKNDKNDKKSDLKIGNKNSDTEFVENIKTLKISKKNSRAARNCMEEEF
jgi:hypothetical protein